MAEKDQLIERLKQEAEIHAQEARTANHTIAEIYQVVSGATGEPGNWHGAEPVRQLMAQAVRFASTVEDCNWVEGTDEWAAREFLRSPEAQAFLKEHHEHL